MNCSPPLTPAPHADSIQVPFPLAAPAYSVAEQPSPRRPTPTTEPQPAPTCTAELEPVVTLSEADAADAGAESEDAAVVSPGSSTAVPNGDPETAAWLATLRDEHNRPVLGFLLHGAPHWRLPGQCDAGELIDRTTELHKQGRYHAAYPLLCELTLELIFRCGDDDPATLAAMCSTIENRHIRAKPAPALYYWAIPRVAKHWGTDDTQYRALVEQAALLLCGTSDDARVWPEFVQLVTEAAQQLPGGLGWGSTVVAPVPDEEAYARHTFMETRAKKAFGEGHYKLAQTMYERCVTFYETLNTHWLACVRKARCVVQVARCVRRVDGKQPALAYLLQAKSTAQRELGMDHYVVLDLAWCLGELLAANGKPEKALPIFQRSARIRQEIVGDRHCMVFADQMAIGLTPCDLGKLSEAEDTLRSTFEQAVLACGPRGSLVDILVINLWVLLHVRMKKQRAAVDFKQRAKKLGCDVSECTNAATAQAAMAFRHLRR